MAVRIFAAISVLVFGLLLALTVYATFSDEPDLVLPLGGVPYGVEDDLPAGEPAYEALRDRTQLQAWRAESGPSPSQPRETVVSGEPIPSGTLEEPLERVRSWLAARDENRALLRDREDVAGMVSLPNESLGVLIQEEGRIWRRAHNDPVTYGGGWAIFGMALFLAVVLLIGGRIRIEEGPSIERIPRFSPFERGNHWMTAVSFLLLAFTGLFLLYGQFFLPALIGAGGYGDFLLFNAYAHIALAIPFVIGIAVMFVIWVGQNLPTGADWRWLKQGGGFYQRGVHPPAARFNAGQKIIFWLVILGGIVLTLSGLSLVFPLFWFGVNGMQIVQVVHAASGLGMTAVILAHIYIGTIGMEGAFDAMWDGTVDRNWAEEHHSLWVARLRGEAR